MIKLSPTTGLSLFQECQRCYWLHYNKRVQRPRGIFPSLPSGMDLVIKRYFDQYRGKLPPEIDGKLEGSLMPDQILMNRWRNWQTGLRCHYKELDAELFGAIDDCLIDDDYYIPIDYKTRGSAPNEGDSEKYYQLQLDTYNLLLNENGYKTKDFAYLIYYFPKEVKENGFVVFDIQVVKVSTDLDRLRKTFKNAVELLKGPLPEQNANCEYCSWINSRIVFEPVNLRLKF